MELKDKFKSYKFWVALSSAVIIFLEVLGKSFGFEISEKVINDIVMAFCGILVVLGFVKDDRTKDDVLADSQDATIENTEQPHADSESLNNNQEKEIKSTKSKTKENQSQNLE